MWFSCTVYDPEYNIDKLHACIHVAIKTDIPRSQCIILKESKYNFGNAIVQEALSNLVLNSYIEGIHLQKMWQTSISRKNANK